MFFLNPPNLFSYFFYKIKNVSLKVQISAIFQILKWRRSTAMLDAFSIKGNAFACNSIEFSHQ